MQEEYQLQEKYFDVLVKKEQMEEKMKGVREMKCRAVSCKKVTSSPSPPDTVRSAAPRPTRQFIIHSSQFDGGGLRISHHNQLTVFLQRIYLKKKNCN